MGINVLSPSATILPSTTITTTFKQLFHSSASTKQHHPSPPPLALSSSSSSSSTSSIATTITSIAAALSLLSSTAIASAAEPSYSTYYGTAASAANYGGYGGNSDKKASAEYIYQVPEGWKERQVSKVEKGTNGTDSEFFNPRKRSEKEYLTFLSGFRQLAPRDSVLNNLALSDVDLQDLISTADSINSEEKADENNGQVYYLYEIQGVGSHSLIKVTCARNKLYAHFVNAPTPDWNRDQDMLRHLHESFKTV